MFKHPLFYPIFLYVLFFCTPTEKYMTNSSPSRLIRDSTDANSLNNSLY